MEKVKAKKKKRIGLRILLVVVAVVAVLAAAFGVYWMRNSKKYDWDLAKVYKAGFEEKDVELADGSIIHYAEGPDNGPDLLLIHGQCTDWTSYSACLPELSKEFHIYAVDCYGHGKSSKNVEKYSANANGADLAWFIQNIIGEKTIVSGHSSGGLLAAWLAANCKDYVEEVVLEDPPFFSCEDNRKEKTWNYVDTSTVCHNFLNQSKETDFTLYYFENSYSWTIMGNAKAGLVKYARKYRSSHEGERLVIGFLPPSFMGVYDAIDNYDPRFGEAFYDGSWNKDFNHGETLAKITCPAVLIHASHKIGDDGILQGAMTDEDAAEVVKLVKGCTLRKSNAIHCVHGLDTNNFIDIVEEFAKDNNFIK